MDLALQADEGAEGRCDEEPDGQVHLVGESESQIIPGTTIS